MANAWRRSPSSRLTHGAFVEPTTRLLAAEFFEPSAALLRGAASASATATGEFTVQVGALLAGTASATSTTTGYLVKGVIAGFLTTGALGGFESDPHISTDLRALDDYLWPPVGQATLPLLAGSLASELPVSTTPRTLTGFLSKSINDDWYHRFHLIPSSIDFGNVATAQTTAFTLWNAFLEPKTLTSITDEGADGLTLTGGLAMPGTVAPLRQLAYQLDAGVNGPSVIAASFTWNFTGEIEPVLPVSGVRIVAWTFAPDWANGITEILHWLTAIFTSPTGAEQRRALRLAPRRQFEATFLVDGREHQLLDTLLASWAGRTWIIPIWHDIQLLPTAVNSGALSITCATANRDFTGSGQALLRGASAFDYEVVQIESVEPGALTLTNPTQKAWPAGTRLYPLRRAQMASLPQKARLTDQAGRVAVSFMTAEACDWPAVLPATLYRGCPVFADRPDEREDLTYSYQRLLATLDNDTGHPVNTDTAGRPFLVQSYRWLQSGRAANAALRSLLYGLNGRQKAVWLPTHADDLTLTASVVDTGVTMDVANCKYAAYSRALPGRRDLRIELRNGTVIHRRITDAIELNSATERLALDAALGASFGPADVARISFMSLCRLDQDSVELLHETDDDGITACQVVFRGVRDDEL